jgi:Eukaryotic aspartyl protease
MLRSLGPTHETIGTLRPDKTASVPTVIDSLYTQKVISSNVFSLYFEPSNSTESLIENGELTLGGYDTSKTKGDPIYA